MDVKHDNVRYVNKSQEVTGIDSSGKPRISPVLSYRKEVGQELFDEVMQSRRGEKILKALIETEVFVDDERSLFDVFVTEVFSSDNLSDSLEEDVAPLVPRNQRSAGDVKDIEPSVSSDLDVFDDEVVLSAKNLLEPENSDDLAVLLEKNFSVLGRFPDILTYSGMFYNREVKINVHYLQDEESRNCNDVLLNMLVCEAKRKLLEQMIKGVCYSEETRENSERLEFANSIDSTFDQKDEGLSGKYPVDMSEFITKGKFVFTDKSAKTLLWIRVVEFNKFIVSALELADIEKLFGYLY